MIVTNENYQKVFEMFKDSCDKAKFVSFDCEMTGLCLDLKTEPTKYDTQEFRYYKVKQGVEKYDLILLDEDLSQISGLELMAKIKEIRNFKTPVILLTKDNSYEYNEEYTKVGFTDYILKPLKKEAVLEKIDKYTKKDNK